MITPSECQCENDENISLRILANTTNQELQI